MARRSGTGCPRALDAAEAVGAECMVFTTGPAGRSHGRTPPTRSRRRSPRCSRSARRAAIPFAIEHTNSLRVDVGFVHTLADAVDLARRLDIGVCVEIERVLGRARPRATIRAGVDTFRLVQVSDFAVGTLSTPNRLVPGDGDIPLARILGQVLAAGYAGCFDLELIGPRDRRRGLRGGVPRAVAASAVS